MFLPNTLPVTSKPGKECLYNTLIMEEWETIAALGSGGSTKYVIHEENRMERIENVKRRVPLRFHRFDGCAVRPVPQKGTKFARYARHAARPLFTG